MYQVEVFEDFSEYELVSSMEYDSFPEMMADAEKWRKQGLSVVIESKKSGASIYMWAGGDTDVYCGSLLASVADKALKEWF